MKKSLQKQTIVLYLQPLSKMVVVAQLVRVAVCGAAGRRFEPGQPPRIKSLEEIQGFFLWFVVKALLFSEVFFSIS